MILVIYNRLSKMTYFVVTIERTLAEGLARLFRNNMWKLHGLLESMILDRKLQFIVELTRKLNQMLEIKTKLLTFFHLQIDRQTKQINQELEQYLWFFVDYKQKDWPEQLVIAEFAVNNKTYLATNMSLFIVNSSRELRMGADIRRKGKIEKAMEFVEKIKKVQKKVEVVLRKV